MPSLPVLCAILIAVINTATFVTFGYDKRCARLDRRRISEATLLGMAWATGCIGGWIAMRMFRHKTRKKRFLVPMVLVTILNPLWLLLWLWVR